MSEFSQMSLFDCLYENYVVKKTIRLIELFAGYGSQALALKYLNAKFEHYRICEWSINSIQCYNDLHIRDYKDYSKDKTKNEIINCLLNYGISLDYKNSINEFQLCSKSENYLRKIYNNIVATHNLVDISKVKACDLQIVDTNKFDYIVTYSFPCQDLSNFGKHCGMKKNSNTRSSLLWQVERILEECVELPQILLMENVPEVINQNNIKDFNLWELKLEQLGYKNYVRVLNASDYGIAQNRSRCFMISILGNYSYQFPTRINLEKKLTDLLDLNQNNDLFLTDKNIESIKNWKAFIKPLEVVESTMKKNLSPTLTTRSGANCSSMILVKQNQKLRYLSCKECFKLMGMKKNDFQNIEINQTKENLYHLAGDSIVTTVLMAIFGKMLNVDYKEKIKEVITNL